VHAENCAAEGAAPPGPRRAPPEGSLSGAPALQLLPLPNTVGDVRPRIRWEPPAGLKGGVLAGLCLGWGLWALDGAGGAASVESVGKAGGAAQRGRRSQQREGRSAE
jgi:hypothetical protein